ncbi:MAG: DNA polymerase III subunit delta' [Deltaproteobacteria bacterium]|nr:DNA polymerase III subunit delta' [Candidatus Anaeroferrophillacea bacterium]
MAFRDVVGHRRIVLQLQALVRGDRLPAALLFAGMSGIGKRLAARGVAQTLLCPVAAGDDACGGCPDCRQVERGIHPDVLHVRVLTEEDRKQILIDQIRAVQTGLGYAPLRGRYKVVIIDAAHMMNAPAANALLKTLEEPPERSLFILVTDRSRVLLPTILSRCLKFFFAPLAVGEVREILSARDSGVAGASLDTAVCLGGGSVSRSLAFLAADRLAWKRDLVARFAGLSPIDPGAAVELAELLAAEGDTAALAAYVLESFLRDVLICSGASTVGCMHADQQSAVRDFAGRCPPEVACDLLRAVNDLQTAALSNINIRLAWETLLLTHAARLAEGGGRN